MIKSLYGSDFATNCAGVSISGIKDLIFKTLADIDTPIEPNIFLFRGLKVHKTTRTIYVWAFSSYVIAEDDSSDPDEIVPIKNKYLLVLIYKDLKRYQVEMQLSLLNNEVVID